MVVMQRYYISIDDLPQPEDEKACMAFQGKLCRDYIVPRAEQLAEGVGQEDADMLDDDDDEGEADADADVDMAEEGVEEEGMDGQEDAPELVGIFYDTHSSFFMGA
jgi:hypothetical protein